MISFVYAQYEFAINYKQSRVTIVYRRDARVNDMWAERGRDVGDREREEVVGPIRGGVDEQR